MRLPLIAIDSVLHVGSLDPARRGEFHAVSYEGAGLSVSPCPGAWRAMASLDGPTWRLSRPGALWLDLAALDADCRGALLAHARATGLGDLGHVWRAWVWEEGRDAWAVLDRREESSARALRGDEPPPGTAPPPGGSTLSRVEVPLLSEAGNARALGFGRWIDATDMLAMFWAEDVLRQAEPDIAGVWWREPFRPRYDQAPRGAILHSCIDGFEAARDRRRWATRSCEPVTDTVWREVEPAPTAPVPG